MSARITINLKATGEVEIWLNEEGRDLLVRELQHLSEKSYHYHSVAPRIDRLKSNEIRAGKEAVA